MTPKKPPPQIKKQKCPNCGSTAVWWFTSIVNRSGKVDNCLSIHDLVVLFTLGCESCSETIRQVDADGKEGQAMLNTPAQPAPTRERSKR